MKLCVFPNDPIYTYYEKGEIKERYFNPCNIFDELHIISLTDKDVEESKVQAIAGKAKLKIHGVGKINVSNCKQNVKRIKELVQTINPDIIRSYNALVEGWLASICSSELNIPLFVSLHTQYDYRRRFYKKTNLKKYLALKYTEKFIEPFVLKKADKITIIYKIIEPYVIKHGGKKPELLYNRIDYERFSNAAQIESLQKPMIISVGSLIKEKYHQCIIEAMKQIDAHCLIIGNGYLYDELINLIKKTNQENKITIMKSVPNHEIPRYYKSAQVFALAYDPELEGLPIPVMEAMAAGLPVIIPYPKGKYSEGLEEIALFSERNPSSFAQNINKVLYDPILHKELSLKSLSKAKDFDSSIIEKREAEIYAELVAK
ncbi:MAG: glycosyltransferase family 4 protein [Nitrosarchaeum sp.]